MDQTDPTNESSIRFIRMNSGEDLVTEMLYVKTEESDEYYIFINPLKIVYSISEKPGFVSISLLQWVLPEICDKQQFTVYPNDITTMSQVTEEMENYYWETLIRLQSSQDERLSRRKHKSKESIDDAFDFDVSDEDLGYVKDMLDDIKNGKRKLH